MPILKIISNSSLLILGSIGRFCSSDSQERNLLKKAVKFGANAYKSGATEDREDVYI